MRRSDDHLAWQAHAAAAKSGVISLTRSAAVEWSNLGIRVNALSPGGIRDTEGLKKLDESLTEGNEFWITSLFPALLLVFGFVIYLWND